MNQIQVSFRAMLTSRGAAIRPKLGGRALLYLGALAVCFTGCATKKEKPTFQRGWIGGQYLQAKKVTVPAIIFSQPGTLDLSEYPKPVQQMQKTALRVKHLGTNTPAAQAGLREGDLVLEANHQPAVKVKQFRDVIERSQPGTVLPLKVYRDGQTAEYNVTVGKETYRRGGNFSLVLPSVIHGWDLWPNPGFSLVLAGFEPNRHPHPELECQPLKEPFYAEDWDAFLVIFDLSSGKRILKQESAAP